MNNRAAPSGNGQATRKPFAFQPRSKAVRLSRLAEHGIVPPVIEALPEPVLRLHSEAPRGATTDSPDVRRGERSRPVRAQVPAKVFTGPYRLFANKAVEYWNHYGKPPGEHVVDFLSELQQGSPDQAGDASARLR